ncbi:MAG: hypothetical protein IIW48_07325 [Clostridia bacterium]|nr:hypothetical protein [Clostridia bacterium]
MSFAAIILAIKNFSHSIVAVVCLLPIMLTMGADDAPGTEVIINENAENSYINEYGNPDVSAHRSGAGVAPQNTIMAFEKMLENVDEFGVDTFEFDVQLTADGELILLHDLTFDATSDAVEKYGRKNIYASQLTYDEAYELNLGENFKLNGEYPYRGLRGDDIPDNLRVAKCEDIFELIESNSNGVEYRYIIEIKSMGKQGKQAADKLYQIVTERGLQDRVIWATFQPDVADYMRKTYPDMPRSADVIEVIQFYVYSRMGWDLDSLDVSYVALQIPYGESALNLINTGTKAFINYAHKYDIAVQYWTINDAEAAQYLINNGADTIMSDYPDMILDLVEAA